MFGKGYDDDGRVCFDVGPEGYEVTDEEFAELMETEIGDLMRLLDDESDAVLDGTYDGSLCPEDSGLFKMTIPGSRPGARLLVNKTYGWVFAKEQDGKIFLDFPHQDSPDCTYDEKYVRHFPPFIRLFYENMMVFGEGNLVSVLDVDTGAVLITKQVHFDVSDKKALDDWLVSWFEGQLQE